MGTTTFADTNRFLGRQYFDSASPGTSVVSTVFLGRRGLTERCGTREATVVTSLPGPGLSGFDNGGSEEVLTISFFVLFRASLEVDACSPSKHGTGEAIATAVSTMFDLDSVISLLEY
jgi:hypothetical protein